jgi:hypothetical protein
LTQAEPDDRVIVTVRVPDHERAEYVTCPDGPCYCNGALSGLFKVLPMNTILEQAGVPDSLRAAWLGHTVVVNRKNYIARPKDLTPVRDIIGDIFKAA